MTLWKRYGVVIIAAIHILLQHDGDAAVSQWPSRIDVHTIYKYIFFMRVGDVGGIEGGMLSGFSPHPRGPCTLVRVREVWVHMLGCL